VDHPEVRRRQAGRPTPVFTDGRLPLPRRSLEPCSRPRRRQRTTGCPSPTTLRQAHPTISGASSTHIARARSPAPEHRAPCTPTRVEFTDGTRVHADVVIYCTGYKITFPFFDEAVISAPDNHIELFWRVFHPDHRDLAFIGLLQPLGAIMPLAEAQGRWVTEYLRGEYHLPSPGRCAGGSPPTRRRCASGT
jgi:hypothetical protein